MRFSSRLRTALMTIGLTTLATALSWAQVSQHPHPQPRPMPPSDALPCANDPSTICVQTGGSIFPAGASNQLANVESNIFDGGQPQPNDPFSANTIADDHEMVNTLPSTSTVPFNLLDGQVQASPIDKTSPKDDLNAKLNAILNAANTGVVDTADIQFAIDILEGNPLPRTYSGFPLLHYNGPNKVNHVTILTDSNGNQISGNFNVHQIWYDNHIEADTAFLSFDTLPNPATGLVQTLQPGIPWTITYKVDVLNGGADDFAPFTMYFDNPSFIQNVHNPDGTTGKMPIPHVAMDSTFTAMGDGNEYLIKVKFAPKQYFNLIYHWGWRIHPPRVQVAENAGKKFTIINPDGTLTTKTLPDWEVAVFGSNPLASEAAKLNAIAQIGELAPAKRIWQDLRSALTSTPQQVASLINDALLSFADWSDRTHLPRGVQADPNADATLFYVNNTMYGNVTTFSNWTSRGTVFKATLYNGDHFTHAYMNVDFGGARGWENQFVSSGGPGGSHTFGRVHWWINAGTPAVTSDGMNWFLAHPITVPPAAADGTPGIQKVRLTLNFHPPARIRLYQFDPMHHDVAVYSLH